MRARWVFVAIGVSWAVAGCGVAADEQTGEVGERWIGRPLIPDGGFEAESTLPVISTDKHAGERFLFVPGDQAGVVPRILLFPYPGSGIVFDHEVTR